MRRIVESLAEVARRWATGACRIWPAGLMVGALWALSVVPASADGIPVGIGSGSGEPLPQTFLEDEGNINIGTPSNPVGIYLDPNGMPVWPKTFVIDRRQQGIATGETFTVNEWISLVPPPDPSIPIVPLTDWHEKIFGPPDFEWGPNPQLDLFDPPIHVIGSNSSDNKEVWFDFDPVYPPEDLKITKTLVYTGPTLTGGGLGPVFEVAIEQRATTPEPGTLALFLSGAGLGWIVWRSRRKSG